MQLGHENGLMDCSLGTKRDQRYPVIDPRRKNATVKEMGNLKLFCSVLRKGDELQLVYEEGSKVPSR